MHVSLTVFNYVHLALVGIFSLKKVIVVDVSNLYNDTGHMALRRHLKTDVGDM